MFGISSPFAHPELTSSAWCLFFACRGKYRGREGCFFGAIFAKIMLKGRVCLSFPHLSHTVKPSVPSSTELSDVELCHCTDTFSESSELRSRCYLNYVLQPCARRMVATSIASDQLSTHCPHSDLPQSFLTVFISICL